MNSIPQPPPLVGGTGAGRAPSFRSPAGKRLYPRVRMGAEADFGGLRVPVADFSVGGLALAVPGPAAAPGDPLRLTLHVTEGEPPLALDLAARVLRVQDGHATALRFVDMPMEAATALDGRIEAWLAGPGQAAAAPPRPLPPPNRTRSLGILVLAAVILGMAAWFMLSSRLLVQSEFGAVAAPLRLIRAPQAGLLTLAQDRPGTALRRDEPIGEVRPFIPAAVTAQMEPQIQALEGRLAQLSGELAQVEASSLAFRRQAEAELAMAAEARRLVERQVATQERLFRRLAGLAAQGFVSAARADQEEVALLARRRELAEAAAAEANARTLLGEALEGRFRSDGRPAARLPGEVRREIAAVTGALEEARRVLARLEAPVPLLSPCHCILAQLGSTTGTVVAAGDPVAGLAEPARDAHAEVDALVASNRLPFLRVGQRVRVYLGGAPTAVEGRITALDHNPENQGRTGLPDNLRTLRSYGLVTVLLPRSVMTTRTGMPAVVEAPVELRTLLLHVPLLGRAFGAAG